jgi:DNA-binding MarR family transcriptional regulator
MEENKNGTAQKLMEHIVKISRTSIRQHKSEGLKHSEMFILFTIKKAFKSDENGIKITELSNKMEVSPPTITQLVGSLEKQDYVQRTMDKGDRRAVRVKLTEKGEAIIDIEFNKFYKTFENLVQYLGEEQSSELVVLLSKVSDYFYEIREKQKNNKIGDDTFC